MLLKGLRIGYVPYLPDLTQPGDRRRFPYFARRCEIEFEIADYHKKYDIILLTAPSNLSLWLDYKERHPNTRFIFEMVDSLIFAPDLFNWAFKGLGRYLIKKERNLHLNYTKLIYEWIKLADVVVCSNEVLRQQALKLNKHAILSPDYLETEYSITKQTYEIEGKLKLVWEGQSSVLQHFLSFKKVLHEVNSFCELHIISTQKYPVLPKVWYSSSEALLKRLPIKTYFHQWNKNSHCDQLIRGDCAIIPLDKRNPYGWHKPANKLVSFWFLGIPSIVSATPAYKEIMKEAGSDLYCDSTEEWVAKLKWIYEISPEERRSIAERNLQFVKENYSDSRLDIIWSNIMQLVAGEIYNNS